MARLGMAGLGRARQGGRLAATQVRGLSARAGACLVQAWQGAARRGWARLGRARPGPAWQGKGMERHWQTPRFESSGRTRGMAWRAQAGRGKSAQGKERESGAHLGSSPRLPRMAWPGLATLVPARPGAVWLGKAGLGAAGLGVVRPGWTGNGKERRATGSHRGSRPRRPRTRQGVAWLGFQLHKGKQPYTGKKDPMDVRFEITGNSPLLMHNISLADPDNEFTREIATFTSKRKKTEDDRRAIERLEWFGGLYVENGRVVMPTGNIRKSFINAGKISKQGTMVSRALNFTELHVPLVYEGPDDLELLYKDPAFHNRAAVGISGKRTMRVRPQFSKWAIVADAILLEDVMDVSDLKRVAERAGLAEGLGDNRVNGYGRFAVKVVA